MAQEMAKILKVAEFFEFFTFVPSCSWAFVNLDGEKAFLSYRREEGEFFRWAIRYEDDFPLKLVSFAEAIETLVDKVRISPVDILQKLEQLALTQAAMASRAKTEAEKLFSKRAVFESERAIESFCNEFESFFSSKEDSASRSRANLRLVK